MRNTLTAIIAVAVSCSAPLQAQTAPEQKDSGGGILDKAINKPGANWAIYGAGQTNKLMQEEGVPGKQFYRVKVTSKGANAWDIGASSPIQKPIAAGDTVLIAIYLRAPELKAGETMQLPYIGSNGAAAPYDGLANAHVTITNTWKLYYASGVASKNFPGNSMNATVHLASDKHVVDLGPVFVLDFGKNPTEKIPDNDTPQ